MANAITLIIAAALTWSSVWQAVTRETNSRAASSRGIAAYAQRSFARAADAFARSRALRPSPSASFNLGTAQVAAGRNAEGAATLGAAMNDRSLRADASYNRGNAELESKQFDRAIADYAQTLRIRPQDASAKRNLEIALARKQQQSQSGESKNRSGSQPNQQGSQPKPQAGNRAENKPKGDANAEALLRAVQQQEQEELQRMKRARGDRERVGW